ncbi:dipeptidase [Cyclobacterium jeungdonense]|uniref:Dipeptidase n=1 Tax=Cyclobacterium jeungdonense TaxID=708087 RepID=A0ABT8C7B4_9BACT|nr:dipeptidase [Cyclobacterium jeungdonense]MDN3687944.1 dipeptidase [Cyclobacterium jeungdonense]
MKKSTQILIVFLILLGFSCGPESSETIDYTALSDEERLTIAQELARNTIMVDGHVDLPYRMKVGGFTLQREILDVSERTEGGNFDYPRSKEGGLDAPFMSIYIPARYQEMGGAKALADSLILMTKRLADTWPDKFGMAYSPEDIQANFEAGKISLPMGMENGAPIGDDLDNLAYFHERGIRYITLTHGKDNLIGDSSYDTTYIHGGLSEFGVEVVKEMNRLGIMVDISHVSDDTFYDVMEVSQVPVIASHSSARHFTPGFERNMGDEMIQRLAENGGVIMINFGGSFVDQDFREGNDAVREHIVNWLAENQLSRNDPEAQEYISEYVAANNPFPSVQKVADHFDHIMAMVGIDHLGFGSDFDGVGDTLPTGLKDVSMYPNLIAELLKRGYSKEDIEKVCYKNLFRVWQAVEEYAANAG